MRETLVAPNGKTLEVLVKGPVGTGTHSRAIQAGETPDEYFRAVVQRGVQESVHHDIRCAAFLKICQKVVAYHLLCWVHFGCVSIRSLMSCAGSSLIIEFW